MMINWKLALELLESVEEYERLRSCTYDARKYGDSYVHACAIGQREMFKKARALRGTLPEEDLEPGGDDGA